MIFLLSLQTNALWFQPIMAWWKWAIVKMASGNGVLLGGIKPSQYGLAISRILCNSPKVKSTDNVLSRDHYNTSEYRTFQMKTISSKEQWLEDYLDGSRWAPYSQWRSLYWFYNGTFRNLFVALCNSISCVIRITQFVKVINIFIK